MALPLDNIVTVSDTIESVGVLRRVFGIGLFFTNDQTLGTGSNRVAVYSNFAGDMADAFAEGTEPYKAGNTWFAQSPFPQNLVVGRWIDTAVSARLYGGQVTTTVSEFAALLATGYVKVSIDGVDYDVNVDLTTVASYADVALAVQNALTTGGASVSVTYNATTGAFNVVSSSTGASSTLSYFGTPSTGVDLAPYLFLSSSLATQLDNGADAETIPEALEAILALNDSWYWVMSDNTIFSQANVQSISNWVETGRYMYSVQSSESAILTTGETSTVAYLLYQEQLQRTFVTYSSSSDYKSVSICARFSSVNFDSANSVITAKFKSLPTITPDDITQTQVSELERKRVNYYTTFATDSIYSEGTTCNNSVYIDTRYALDWFANAVQVDTYDLLRGSGRVAQTDAGEAEIVSVLDGVCRQALTNGMIAGGTVSEVMKSDIIATTGNTSFDGNLTKGYLIWSQPSSAQSQADRAARKATAKKIWLKSSGAIHTVDISVTLEN